MSPGICHLQKRLLLVEFVGEKSGTTQDGGFMRRFFHRSVLALLIVFIFGVDGCATLRTLPSMATPDHPKIYSGARLDFNAITENEQSLRKFKATAPIYPLLDLPFSVILDTAVLPLTFPVASYELLFGL
jgi:uncharacterized protein YceK